MGDTRDRFSVLAMDGQRVFPQRQFRTRLAALRFADRELLGGHEVILLLGRPGSLQPRAPISDPTPSRAR